MTEPLDHKQSLATLRKDIRPLEPREAYEASMQSAANLVEDAAYLLAPLVPGAKVVELLLLSTRIEAIGADPSLLNRLLDLADTQMEPAPHH